MPNNHEINANIPMSISTMRIPANILYLWIRFCTNSIFFKRLEKIIIIKISSIIGSGSGIKKSAKTIMTANGKGALQQAAKIIIAINKCIS